MMMMMMMMMMMTRVTVIKIICKNISYFDLIFDLP